MKIVAIDFEIANHSNLSICSVGIAVFENGQLADTYYSLIRPPKGYGWFRPDWIDAVLHGGHIYYAPTLACGVK